MFLFGLYFFTLLQMSKLLMQGVKELRKRGDELKELLDQKMMTWIRCILG